VVAKDRMPLLELLSKAGLSGDVDSLREGVRVLAQALVDADASRRIGAEPYENSVQRQTRRNGYRDRPWVPGSGASDLRIPKLRVGSFLPEFLGPRRPTGWALLSDVQEAYIQGVSTRRMDEVLKP